MCTYEQCTNEKIQRQSVLCPQVLLSCYETDTGKHSTYLNDLKNCFLVEFIMCDNVTRLIFFNKLTQPQFISQVLSRLEGNILKISRKFLANLKLHILLKDIGTRKRKYFRWTIFRHEHLFKYCNCFHPRHHCKLLFHYTTDSSSLASVHSKSLLKKLYSAPLESCSTYKSMMY